jgi:MarR family transcriptional regulator, transcriptional regulator for hemolysin
VEFFDLSGELIAGATGAFFALDHLRIVPDDIISLLIMSVAYDRTLSPARELAFALHDTARLLRTYSDFRARQLNTTRAQWAVLARLYRCEGVKQSELAEALDLAPITLARLIDKLNAAGLVERRDDPADRRAHRLYLTEKAAPALSKLGALAEDVMGKALDGLDEKEVRSLHDGLNAIKANLKTELHSGACRKMSQSK